MSLCCPARHTSRECPPVFVTVRDFPHASAVSWTLKDTRRCCGTVVVRGSGEACVVVVTVMCVVVVVVCREVRSDGAVSASPLPAAVSR
ncbi:hypothetical protein E2C01_050523 [Portunus trituberculatus]|uniref:Uncharacterized protein n=1 Tax=Portunus trituberculatus TaxID=210409 RepID=A0A5B7GCC3_PORTR|nr:hypothetical protein [Portunus trituberculatus]